MGLPKIKLSNYTCYTHQIFRVGKYKFKKKKIDNTWHIEMGGSPQTGPPKFQLFNHSC